jgi:hypothetical protein
MTSEKLSASELELGDVVSLESITGFGCCVVTAITPSYVEFFRPYACTADFSGLGHIHEERGLSVIPYIGVETWRDFRNRPGKHFILWSRKTLK